ncbi:MAG: hypothetical protein PSV16_14010 [Flavobacterium sp.]|nr:hypothetical protein [Flavobacterium sp.]
MKKIYLLLLVALTIGCHGQEKVKTAGPESPFNKDDVDNFFIGGYAINPKLKEINRAIETGGASWDGIGWVKASEINFESTSLIFIGHSMIFKEQMPAGCDMKTLGAISSEWTTAFKDNHKIYTAPLNGYRAQALDISNYKVLSKRFYQDSQNNIWALLGDLTQLEYSLQKIITNEKVDFHTLQYLTGYFYADENGLYYAFSESNKQSSGYYYNLKKICDDGGENTTPFVAKNYLVYGKCVYSLKSGTPFKLDLDVSKMKEISAEFSSNHSYLTDGKRTYKANNANNGYDTITKYERRYQHQVLNEIFTTNGITVQKIYSEQLVFCEINNTDLIFSNENHKSCNKPLNEGRLIKTSAGYYWLAADSNAKKAKKINNVFFYNVATKKNEVFDANQFTYFKDGFYRYKNQLYRKTNLLATNLDVEKTKLIQQQNEVSNFLTDGNNILYIGNITGYSNSTVKGIEQVMLTDRSIKNINISNIKIANEDVLILNDAVVVSKGAAISIAKLGIDVKVYSED